MAQGSSRRPPQKTPQNRTPRPARTLLIFGLVIVAMYALVAFTAPAVKGESRWSPKLGLDLAGGTRILLTAAGSAPSPSQLEEARQIVDQRVNGTGVSEAEVSTQGSRNIVVEIPGRNSRDLVESIARTAQLRFRLVAGTAPAPGTTTPSASPSGSPSGSPSTSSSASPSANPSAGAASPSASGSASPRSRPAPFADVSPTTTPSPSATGSRAPSPAASPAATPSASPTRAPATGPRGVSVTPPLTGKALQTWRASVDKPTTWQQQPDQYSQAAFTSFTCPRNGGSAIDDTPDAPLVACDAKGNKFLLSKTVIEGTQLSTASFGPPPQGVGWAVTLSFKSAGAKAFADVSRQLAGTGRAFAVVLDNMVLSTPTFTEAIPDGNAIITGDFTQTEARNLSNSLKFGALPVRFTEPSSEQVGASLAGNQLYAGIVAGIVGLVLVMLYCLAYYRGLGLVVVASLGVAGVITYAAVLLLAKGAGFTLTLPGIAGLIVAVGITADSFIVYFERIRDEMREGRSMRVAVETGWARARNTCLAADAVSLLAAVVLYIFTIGVVKGFAFALGISTLIDLAVFFFFTKPAMTALAKRTFFNGGGAMSGLSYESLGIDGPSGGRAGVATARTATARTAGGNA